MPIYTYRCKCGLVFEVPQPYFSKSAKCELCGKTSTEKVLSPPIITRVKEIRTVGQQGEANFKKDKTKIQEISEMKREEDKERRKNSN